MLHNAELTDSVILMNLCVSYSQDRHPPPVIRTSIRLVHNSHMIYLNDSAKQPLQLVLRSILIQNQPESGMIADMQSTAARAQLVELLKYATIIISSLPLLVMYPFFQKYFDSGIMTGAVKG